MATASRFTSAHSSRDHSVPGGTNIFNTSKPRKTITLTEKPSWRTIRSTTTTGQDSDNWDGGTGRVRPAPVHTKPEWPKELTGTITVRPYPTSTTFTKRGSPIVSSLDKTLAPDLWDTFGVAVTPPQYSDKKGEDVTDSNGNEAQNTTLGIVDHAQNWIEGVLDRAQTEFHNIIDSLSNAVGFVNMIMGWNGEDSHN